MLYNSKVDSTNKIEKIDITHSQQRQGQKLQINAIKIKDKLLQSSQTKGLLSKYSIKT